MEVQIRAISEHELVPFILAAEAASSEATDEAEIERERSLAEPDRCLAAFDGPDIVGTAGAFTMPMTIPGGRRSSGSRRSLACCPRIGAGHRGAADAPGSSTTRASARELLSVLYASEGGIYGRFGYGIGTIGLSMHVGTARSAFVRGYAPSGEMRLVERDRAIKEMLAVHEATRLEIPGMVHLDERRLTYVLGHEHGAEKLRPTMFALHEGASGVDGFVAYKVAHEWPQGFSESTLDIRELAATNPGAYADLWRYVLDLDLVAKVEASNRPIDEPLFHLIREPKRLRADVRQPVGAARRRRGRARREAVHRRRPGRARGRRPLLPVERGRYVGGRRGRARDRRGGRPTSPTSPAR